jgi:predicted porin
MNRILTTAGLAVLGAASMVPASAQMTGLETKPWAVSAQLRGFYDDNYLTYPKALRNAPGFDDNTFGFDISPSVAYNLRRNQTEFGASYLYTLRYYADRANHKADHSHQANLKLSHAFSERYSVDLKDSFVVAQEPSIIDPTISLSIPARSEGNNVRNQAGVQFNANLLEHFGISLGYNNTVYDYEQDAPAVGLAPLTPGGPGVIGSRSAVLDRMEQSISLDGNYQILPKTTLSLGYIYGINDYTSKDLIFGASPGFPLGIPGSVRDSDFHVVTVGVRQSLNPQLSVSAKVGVQLTTYDKSTLFNDETNPYAEASASWAYAEGSALQFGLRHTRVPTDVRQVPGAGGTAVLNADSEATSVFASVTHRIAAKLSINAMAQYQHATFNDAVGSTATREFADDLFYAGINLTYDFTKNVSAELGYTYDRLDSDISFGGVGRSFTRNRVYAGARFTY